MRNYSAVPKDAISGEFSDSIAHGEREKHTKGSAL